jgi:hypothetical protein
LPEPNKFVGDVGDVAQQLGQLVRIVEFGNKANVEMGSGLAGYQQVGQQIGSVEFISQQVVQLVRVWCTKHELVGQQVANFGQLVRIVGFGQKRMSFETCSKSVSNSQ